MDRLLHIAIERTEQALAESRMLIAKSQQLISQSRATTVALRQKPAQRIELNSSLRETPDAQS